MPSSLQQGLAPGPLARTGFCFSGGQSIHDVGGPLILFPDIGSNWERIAVDCPFSFLLKCYSTCPMRPVRTWRSTRTRRVTASEVWQDQRPICQLDRLC